MTRASTLSAPLGALPFIIYLLFQLDPSLESFVMMTIVLVALAGLGGAIFGRGLAMAQALTAKKKPAARISVMGLVGALLGLPALYPLFQNIWSCIAGLVLGLFLAAVETVTIPQTRLVRIAAGVAAGLVSGFTIYPLGRMFSPDINPMYHVLSVVAFMVFATSLLITSEAHSDVESAEGSD
jgi:hypothetical protein